MNTIDRDKPYTITGAPRVVKGKVMIGNGGAEYGVRGYVTAYDAETGTQVWRFYTVPGDPSKPFEHPELEAAAKTWNGRWWELGGGGTAWDSMAYDPELDLLYVGTGNGSPWSRKLRSPGGGDNLYLSSILALRPDTGRLVWHYQTTPGDNWDYTAAQQIVLADLDWNGAPRKVLMQAPKNGFFYVLDRATGELLSAEKFVRVNWASHVDREDRAARGDAGGQLRRAPALGAAVTERRTPLAPDVVRAPRRSSSTSPCSSSAFLYALDPAFKPVKGAWNLGLDLRELSGAAGGARVGDAARVGRAQGLGSRPAEGGLDREASRLLQRRRALDGGRAGVPGHERRPLRRVRGGQRRRSSGRSRRTSASSRRRSATASTACST